jgi:tetratricopeptide (TPR) repeat protein
LYTGQYRKALETLDRMVGLYWEAHDTTNAITKQMEKAVFFQEGLGDARNAWLEVQKTFPYRQRSGSGVYTGWFSILSCFRGDFHLADSLSSKNPLPGWAQYIRMLILLEKKDFPQAEIQGDSALALAGYSFVRPFCLFPLVQAQFGNGHSDAAIRTLIDLQKGADESLKRRALYYPKSFYLLGTIYEKKGDTKQAIQNYEKFLDLWKNADLNIPELMNAKTRLAKLKGMTTR